MKSIRFETEIGDDQVIRPPKDVHLDPGRVEVIVRKCQDKKSICAKKKKSLQERLATAAEELGIPPLPQDLAENHDHYAHGAPKGVDRR